MQEPDSIRQYRSSVSALLNLINSLIRAPIPEDRARALMAERRALRLTVMASRQIRDLSANTDPVFKAEQDLLAPDTETTETDKPEEQEPQQLPKRGRKAA